MCRKAEESGIRPVEQPEEIQKYNKGDNPNVKRVNIFPPIKNGLGTEDAKTFLRSLWKKELAFPSYASLKDNKNWKLNCFKIKPAQKLQKSSKKLNGDINHKTLNWRPKNKLWRSAKSRTTVHVF